MNLEKISPGNTNLAELFPKMISKSETVSKGFKPFQDTIVFSVSNDPDDFKWLPAYTYNGKDVRAKKRYEIKQIRTQLFGDLFNDRLAKETRPEYIVHVYTE